MHELNRRAFGAIALCGLAGPALAQGDDRRVEFKVLRGGKPMGFHTVRVRSLGDRRTASIVAEFVVKLGPVPVFKYRHEATEIWDGPRFVSLVSRSVSNGKVETVDARPSGEGVRIERSGGPVVTALAGCSPLTHWNREALKRPLFNPQTGALLKCAVARRGVETVRTFDGRAVQATAFAITGEADIVDWYDEDGGWVALQAKGPDGSGILYRRV